MLITQISQQLEVAATRTRDARTKIKSHQENGRGRLRSSSFFLPQVSYTCVIVVRYPHSFGGMHDEEYTHQKAAFGSRKSHCVKATTYAKLVHARLSLAIARDVNRAT